VKIVGLGQDWKYLLCLCLGFDLCS